MKIPKLKTYKKQASLFKMQLKIIEDDYYSLRKQWYNICYKTDKLAEALEDCQDFMDSHRNELLCCRVGTVFTVDELIKNASDALNVWKS